MNQAERREAEDKAAEICLLYGLSGFPAVDGERYIHRPFLKLDLEGDFYSILGKKGECMELMDEYFDTIVSLHGQIEILQD